MIPAPSVDSRRSSLATVLLRTTWILTATVLIGMIGLPLLGALNKALGNTELLRILSIPFVLLWMIFFVFNKIVSAILLVCSVAVAVTPGIELKNRIISARSIGLVGVSLLIW